MLKNLYISIMILTASTCFSQEEVCKIKCAELTKAFNQRMQAYYDHITGKKLITKPSGYRDTPDIELSERDAQGHTVSWLYDINSKTSLYVKMCPSVAKLRSDIEAEISKLHTPTYFFSSHQCALLNNMLREVSTNTLKSSSEDNFKKGVREAVTALEYKLKEEGCDN